MKHITLEQRYTISAMLSQGFKQKEIALTIGKDKSTISREIKRNCDRRSGAYRQEMAHGKYLKRQQQKPRYKRFINTVKCYIDNLLYDDYSPEQIFGRSKLEGLPCVCHETIYQYIWNDKKKGGLLYKHLRHKGRKYRKRGSLKDKRGIIKNRVDISQRPEIVNAKTRFGDLEIDTVIGKNHKGALLTINDRVTGLAWIRKLVSRDAELLASETIKALYYYKPFIHTITSDNGKEFAQHRRISKKLQVDMYFAQPYHSWERGANENMNGLIRQYFPKKTSFENITNQDIANVQFKLNNRPRKKLGFMTPNEYFLANFTNNKVAFET